MIDIEVTRNRDRVAVVIAVPRPRSRSASTARHDITAVTLQHGFPRVARSRDSDPVLEEIAVVGWAVVLGFNSELGEVCAGGGDGNGSWEVSTASDKWFDGRGDSSAGGEEDGESGVEGHGSE